MGVRPADYLLITVDTPTDKTRAVSRPPEPLSAILTIRSLMPYSHAVYRWTNWIVFPQWISRHLQRGSPVIDLPFFTTLLLEQWTQHTSITATTSILDKSKILSNQQINCTAIYGFSFNEIIHDPFKSIQIWVDFSVLMVVIRFVYKIDFIFERNYFLKLL